MGDNSINFQESVILYKTDPAEPQKKFVFDVNVESNEILAVEVLDFVCKCQKKLDAVQLVLENDKLNYLSKTVIPLHKRDCYDIDVQNSEISVPFVMMHEKKLFDIKTESNLELMLFSPEGSPLQAYFIYVRLRVYHKKKPK